MRKPNPTFIKMIRQYQTTILFPNGTLHKLQAHRLTHQRKQLKQEAKEKNKKEISANKEDLYKRATGVKQESMDDALHLGETEVFKHPAKEDTTNEQLLCCDFSGCFFNTKSSSNLTQHLRVHNDEKTFECPTCFQKFRSSSNLKVHIRSVHTKERTFACDHCEKRFATKWQKQSHIKTNHIRKREATFDCTIFGC